MDLSEWIAADIEELGQCLRRVQADSGEQLVGAVVGADRVFVLGLGRSGLVMRMFALRLMQVGVVAFVVGDATTPAIGPGDLLIAGSGSGETEGVLMVAAKARASGARVAAVTADVQSSLAQLAEVAVVVPGATPKLASQGPASRLPLATVLEQAFLVVTDCVIAHLADELRQTDDTMMARHANLE